MKAILADRYGPPEVLRYTTVLTPTVNSGQALVKVHAASLNTADSDHLQGFPRVARIGLGLLRPSTGRVGLDVAGTVEEVAPDVTDLRPGDEVWADLFTDGRGSLAEYVCAAARSFAPKPAGVTFEAAATVPHSGLLALQGLRSGGPIQPGDDLLINGAGGCVGPFAIQIAKAAGATVTAVDHTGTLDMLRELGADHVVDYTREDITSTGRRYDRILDIAATRPVYRFRRLLTPQGRYVLIARTLGGFVTTAVVGTAVTATSSVSMGMFSWRPNVRSQLEGMADLLNGGEVVPRIDRRFPLADAADAFRHLQSGKARGKVVVIPPTEG